MNLSSKQVLDDVADVLYVSVDELDLNADLTDQGMDSIRIMDLVERWRRAGVEHVDFIMLAEDQRLSHWLKTIEELQEN